jgi:hypothetical protein
MSSFNLRPSFSLVLDSPAEAARERIVAQIKSDKAPCDVKTFPGMVSLYIPDAETHFWSPRLSVSIDPRDEGGSLLQGTYGPDTNVWAIFVYGYLLTGSVGLFSGILGFCQWKLGYHPWALWIFAVAVVGAVGLYVFAQFGQKLGARQTFLLHQMFEKAVGRTVEIH